jgi:hypothetical protein
VDALSKDDQATKRQRARLDEIMPATKSTAPSRNTSLNKGEAYWFEPETHPALKGFWSFPK